MKILFSFILSLLIFGASFQNSLLLVDYQLNRDFYETHCINKAKPKMDCHGKCQIQKETEKPGNLLSGAKYASDFHILPIPQAHFGIEVPKVIIIKNKIKEHLSNVLTDDFVKLIPHPPEKFIS